MRWLLIFLMVVFTSPSIAQTQSAPTKDPVTQEQLQETLAEVKGMMARLREELKGDLSKARDDAMEAMKTATGAVVGAVVIDLAGGGGIATFVGGLLGGAIGNWVITTPNSDGSISEKSPSKANLRTARVAGPRIMTASAGRY
jgi:uncharacterized protein YcfJ